MHVAVPKKQLSKNHRSLISSIFSANIISHNLRRQTFWKALTGETTVCDNVDSCHQRETFKVLFRVCELNNV